MTHALQILLNQVIARAIKWLLLFDPIIPLAKIGEMEGTQ